MHIKETQLVQWGCRFAMEGSNHLLDIGPYMVPYMITVCILHVGPYKVLYTITICTLYDGPIQYCTQSPYVHCMMVLYSTVHDHHMYIVWWSYTVLYTINISKLYDGPIQYCTRSPYVHSMLAHIGYCTRSPYVYCMMVLYSTVHDQHK